MQVLRRKRRRSGDGESGKVTYFLLPPLFRHTPSALFNNSRQNVSVRGVKSPTLYQNQGEIVNFWKKNRGFLPVHIHIRRFQNRPSLFQVTVLYRSEQRWKWNYWMKMNWILFQSGTISIGRMYTFPISSEIHSNLSRANLCSRFI